MKLNKLIQEYIYIDNLVFSVCCFRDIIYEDLVIMCGCGFHFVCDPRRYRKAAFIEGSPSMKFYKNFFLISDCLF